MAPGIEELRDRDLLEQILSEGTGVLFKHSTRCRMSVRALEEIQTLLRSRPDLTVWQVDVLRQRALSDEMARRLQIRHESPQVIVLEDGKVRWHASHAAVKAAALSKAIPSAGAPSLHDQYARPY